MKTFQASVLKRGGACAALTIATLAGFAFTEAPRQTVSVVLAGGSIVDIDAATLTQSPPANKGHSLGAVAANHGAIIGYYDNGHNYYAEHMRAKSATLGSVDIARIDGRDLSATAF